MTARPQHRDRPTWAKLDRRHYLAVTTTARATVHKDTLGWAATITDHDGHEVAVRNLGSRRAAQRWAAAQM